MPAIRQDPGYHHFADQRTVFGIPNFWNVATNLPFLLVAVWGLGALAKKEAFVEAWERRAYAIFLVGIALVAFGSGYYHAWPSDATLVWDRLPMTIAFMSLLALVAGERVSPTAGRGLLFPLLALGLASVVYWAKTGDLRVYVFVQFYPMVAMPLMLLFYPARYTRSDGLVALAVFYVTAKVLESLDGQIGKVLATGGHPWKHVAAAVGVFCYVNSIRHRRPAKC